MWPAQAILGVMAAYLGTGLVFGLGFVSAGVGRVDPATRGASIGFRGLILPGTMLLWPVMAMKWWRAGREGPR